MSSKKRITMASLLRSTGLTQDSSSSDNDTKYNLEEQELESQIKSLKSKIKQIKKSFNKQNIKKGINYFKNILPLNPSTPKSPKSPKSSNIQMVNHAKIKLNKCLQGHGNKVQGLAWKSDNSEIVSIAQDGYMFIWNALTGNKRAAIPLTTSWPMCVDWSDDTSLIAVAGLDSICSIYNVSNDNVGWLSKRPECELVNHQGYISGSKFIDNDKILTCSGDSSIIYWDIEYTKPISMWKHHSADISAIDVNKDNKNSFISVSCDSHTKVWDVNQPKRPIHTFKGLKNDLNDCKYFPDYQSIGVASDNGETLLYDIPSRQKICSYIPEKTKSNAMCVDFSKSGKYIFTAYDGEPWLSVWDTINCELIQSIPHQLRASAIGVSPNGKTLVSGSWDNKLRLWS